MPPRVTGVEIPVTSEIIEIVSAKGCDDIMDPRIIKQATKVFALIWKRNYARTFFGVMGLPVVTSTVGFPYKFELVGNPVNAVIKKSGEMQEAKCSKKTNLLFVKSGLGHD